MTAPSPRIAVHGADGRLGRLIVAEADTAYVGPVLRGGAVPNCDVVIDVSSAQGLGELLARASGIPLVVGTTGELPWEALKAHGATAPVAVVPNFSAGVPLLLNLVEQAMGNLPEGWQVEVVETHHVAKKDAPSGTAKRIVKAIGQDVPTQSLRVGDTIGEHTILLTGPGERVEIKHIAMHREVFAIGALRWARWVLEQSPGLYRP